MKIIFLKFREWVQKFCSKKVLSKIYEYIQLLYIISISIQFPKEYECNDNFIKECI